MTNSERINKKNKQTLASLVRLMKDIDQKYSIKVGIIGEKAQEQHSDSGLTNAELGAIHEFGCTINVTDKTGKLISIQAVTDDNDLMIINRSGLTIRTSADQIRVAGRATQGVRVINLREGDSIASVTAVPKTEEAEEIGSVGEEEATAPVVEPQIENSNE